MVVRKVETDCDGLKKKKNAVKSMNGKQAGTKCVTQGPRG
jgi:hypothetical protein